MKRYDIFKAIKAKYDSEAMGGNLYYDRSDETNALLIWDERDFLATYAWIQPDGVLMDVVSKVWYGGGMHDWESASTRKKFNTFHTPQQIADAWERMHEAANIRAAQKVEDLDLMDYREVDY